MPPDNRFKQDDENIISRRKADHIRINLDEDVQSNAPVQLEDLHFEHRALPSFDLKDIDVGQTLFSKKLRSPFLISSMTGGTEKAWEINQKLAHAAQEYGFAMGLGSQRAAIENPELAYTFKVRNAAPDILLFANLGAVQLNYGYSVEQCQRAVEMIAADALILHLNPLQEALQPEGDTNFGGLLEKIEDVCKKISVPVIVKEVGWGISGTTAASLISAGVSAIDAAGAGGTSWAKVERHRARSESDAEIATSFYDWGIPTAEAIRQIRQVSNELPIFASGGIRNGVDTAKAIALGACLAGMAGKLLRAAEMGEEVLGIICSNLIKELKIAMFAAGAINIQHLQKTPLYSW
jgi:isopentenyl-diphosphate delta-isomerase